MRDGFVKVGAATPDILVADCVHNREEIVKKVKEMAEVASCACKGRTSQT